MAQNKGTTGKVTGGNTPRPPKAAPKSNSASAKDRSREQSRSVSAKAPKGAGRSTSRGKGTATRQAAGKAPAKGPRRLSGTAMAWGAIAVVIVVVIVLVVVKVTSGNGGAAPVPVTPAPASLVKDLTSIPQSVYDQVGVTSPKVTVTAPIMLSDQPALTIDGKTPAMLYYGAEYCPYCAAERWAMTAALSRFGTWDGLKVTASSNKTGEPFPATNTLSYRGASLTSQYLTFFGVEANTNVPTSDGSGYTTLDIPTKDEQKVITKYSSPTYIPGAQAGSVSFPFIDIGNVMLISGSSFSPGILAGQSHDDIAGGLSDPTNPATQAIVATANYITAGICASTNNQPSSVCQSSGVQAATKALQAQSS